MINAYDRETLNGLEKRFWALCLQECALQAPFKANSPYWILEYGQVTKIATLYRCLSEIALPVHVESLANIAMAVGGVKGQNLSGHWFIRWNPKIAKNWS